MTKEFNEKRVLDPCSGAASDLKQILEAETGVIISQFLLFMQSNGVWPCWQLIGDDPQPLIFDELKALKDEFKMRATLALNAEQSINVG